jgi:hypothetical protein
MTNQADDEALADYIISFLNELVKVDLQALEALVETRVPCNEILAQHPTVQVTTTDEGAKVGLLGILNGIVGARPEDGWGYIAANFGDDGHLIDFQRTPPKQVTKQG